MRADRLVATLLLMQARVHITAAELATELEISVATARRDLEALSTAGVPVYSQPGRGGGWSLVGGARTDLSGLNAAETQALFLLAGTTGSAEVRSALRKLVRALPETFRADAQAAAAAVVVDPLRWGAGNRELPVLVDLLQTAVVRRRKVSLVYSAKNNQRTDRLVDPWGLIDKDEVWYLLAGTDNGQRTFRVDRVVDAEITDLVAERPVDFDLASSWEAVVDRMEERRSVTEATITVAARFLPVLRSQFGRHCHLQDTLRGDHVRVRLAAPTPLMIAQHLAGWGTAIHVEQPEAVRSELARIGIELSARYAG